MHERALARRRSGWPYHGRRQKVLLFSALALVAGTALPWVVILGKAIWASPNAITWTLWGALMVLAAASVRPRLLVLVSAVAGGAVTVAFALWQTARILGLCGVTIHCVPGPGLGFLLIGGIASLGAAWGLFRDRAAA